ncbi:WD40-repeat-containing domain protein [Geopyxis carbonaria]|nr:WD40-repeat-containing domain protein [Geopyxis carbonaria]
MQSRAEEENRRRENQKRTEEGKQWPPNSSMASSSFSQTSNQAIYSQAMDSEEQLEFTGPSQTAANNLSEDDEMYPTRPSVTSQNFDPPPLTIAPTLTTPGYGVNPPRLNWAFLFKSRRRLDENWLHNRCTPFQIPHPSYPHEGHRECIYTIQYSSKYLCSGSRDKSIRVWNVKTRRLRGQPLIGHTGSVLCLQFDESPGEDVIISGSSDASVIVWRFSTGERLQTIPKAHEESVLNLRFSKKWLVTCSKDKLIKIWNRTPLETQDPDYPWHSKLVFGPGKAPLNHPHHPNYQPQWNIQEPSASSGLGLQNPFAQGPANFITRTTQRVVPKTLPVYTAVNALQGHAAAVNAIQLNGNEIVSASGDRVIKLWNLRSGMCEKTYLGHQKGIACIQFDGKTIVSGSSDQTIRVFDRETQAELATLRGHSALVRTVQATRNKIVSGSYDETVRVWRREEDTGEWIPGPVLRQAHMPQPVVNHPNNGPHTHAQLQMNALQQFQSNQMNNGGVVPDVQMHQVQQVGAGMAGAVAAAQLLPNQHHHAAHHNAMHLGQQMQQQLQQQQQQMQALHQQQQQQQQQQLLQQQQTQVPAPPPMAVHPLQAQAHQVTGLHRVFKLQFDARWIICCSQDSRIVGWDYADGEEGIIEASRFFVGGPTNQG